MELSLQENLNKWELLVISLSSLRRGLKHDN